ncbi:MAG: helix-turn-helix domain-containing protein [Phycisphaera sp.]|nr:helix-turn-helix domain-containing protein [Phycisphaera sp.]
MVRRVVSISPVGIYPLTGYFHEGPNYGIHRSRGSEDYLLIYTLSGGGRLIGADGESHCRAHEVVLFKPGFEHGYFTDESCGEWEFYWAHFLPRADFTTHLDWPPTATGMEGCCRLAIPEAHGLREQIVNHMAQVHRLMCGYAPMRSQLAQNALESALLWCDTVNPRTQRETFDRRVRIAMDHVARSLHRRITVDELARLVHLSPSRFAHLFRDQTGLTPIAFVEQQRLARAQQLLELTSLSVAQVSQQVGFESPFYFSRRFARALGHSPRAYRVKVRQALAGGDRILPTADNLGKA